MFAEGVSGLGRELRNKRRAEKVKADERMYGPVRRAKKKYEETYRKYHRDIAGKTTLGVAEMKVWVAVHKCKRDKADLSGRTLKKADLARIMEEWKDRSPLGVRDHLLEFYERERVEHVLLEEPLRSEAKENENESEDATALQQVRDDSDKKTAIANAESVGV